MLSALELANIIDNINSIIRGKDYYVSDIYPILNDTYIFKLHHAFENDILLVISPISIWITKYLIKDRVIPLPSFMVSLERLKRCKVLDIKQLNNDRVLYIKFLDKIGKEEVIFYLIVELFNNGNMILCDSKMRIISLLKHNKRVHINDRYTPPLEERLDPLKIEYEEFKRLFEANISIDRLLISKIALSSTIIRLILDEAKIESTNEEALDRLYYSLKNIVRDIRDGKRSLIVSDSNNYLEAIDKKFSSIIIDKLEHIKNNNSKEELLRTIKVNENKKHELEKKARSIRDLAIRFSSNSINEDEIDEAKRLGITYKGNSYSTASRLYNIAKRLEVSIRNIENEILDNKEKLAKIKLKTINIREKRDLNWFERYRWFITSDNLLAVGGRDVSSNSTLLRRYAKDDDIIFHTDIKGSPFFILKDEKENSIEEVAIATASFSRAWREGINAIDVYYIRKKQLISKDGSYTISGKRNYIKGVELRLGIGIINYHNNKYLVSAPIRSLSKYIIIKPGDKSKDKIARDIRDRLIDIDIDFMRMISIEDILKILPNGNIDIL